MKLQLESPDRHVRFLEAGRSEHDDKTQATAVIDQFIRDYPEIVSRKGNIITVQDPRLRRLRPITSKEEAVSKFALEEGRFISRDTGTRGISLAQFRIYVMEAREQVTADHTFDAIDKVQSLEHDYSTSPTLQGKQRLLAAYKNAIRAMEHQREVFANPQTSKVIDNQIRELESRISQLK